MMGFYTTRFVKAIDEESAEIEAVNLIKQDESLRKITKNKRWQPEPMIYLDEIERIEESDIEEQHGYVWFDMKEKE